MFGLNTLFKKTIFSQLGGDCLIFWCIFVCINLVFQSKCRPNVRGGGILVLYKDSMECEQLENDFYFETMEIMILKFQYKSETVTFEACWMPSNTNINQFSNELELILTSNVMKHETNFIMAGDINIGYLWQMYGRDRSLDILYTYELINTIRKHTSRIP